LLGPRSWPTSYRGPLAIHAAKAFPGWACELCLTSPFFEALTEGRGAVQALRLPLGKVVAVAPEIRPTWGVPTVATAVGVTCPPVRSVVATSLTPGLSTWPSSATRSIRWPRPPGSRSETRHERDDPPRRVGPEHPGDQPSPRSGP